MNAGKMLVCPCSTRVCMNWQLSLWTNLSVLRGVMLNTVELIRSLFCCLAFISTDFQFSQGQWQTGMLFLTQLDPSNLVCAVKKALHKLPDATADCCWVVPLR